MRIQTIFLQVFCLGTLSLSAACLAQNAPPAIEDPPDAIKIAPAALLDQATHKVLPDFPKSALGSHKFGLAVLTVLVGKDGAVEKVLRAAGDPEFVEPSEQAALKWTFKTALVKNEPVRLVSLLYFFFRPRHGSADPTVELLPAMARISGGVAAGFAQKKVQPSYPEDAKMARISGSVIMLVIIGTDGKIEEISTVSGPEPLRAAAIEALSQWTYKPYMLNGIPTVVETTVTMNFNISH